MLTASSQLSSWQQISTSTMAMLNVEYCPLTVTTFHRDHWATKVEVEGRFRAAWTGSWWDSRRLLGLLFMSRFLIGPRAST